MKKGYQPILDYVEGRMTVDAFRQELLQSSSLKDVLSKWKCKMTALKEYEYNFYSFLMSDWRFKNTNWNNVATKYYLFWWLVKLLQDNKVDFTPIVRYEQDYNFLLSIQPSWLDINNDDVFQKVIEEIPNNLSKTQQIKLGKEKVKTLFKYDKTYPRWVQSPEWPIVNGKPLVFSHQKKVKGDDCHTYYYFYDEKTKEQTIVEQFG